MKRLKIFISSVQNEFAKERAELASYFRQDPLLGSFFEPFIFEQVPANTHIYNLIKERGLKPRLFSQNEGFKLTIWRPSAETVHDTIHDTEHDASLIITEIAELTNRLVLVIHGEMSRTQLIEKLELKNRSHFSISYLEPALKEGLIEMTLPDKSKSKNQKYRLTSKGLALKANFEDKNK